MAHLVWDWNGTLLDDLALVVDATNASLAVVGGPVVTVEEHRRDFRRPIVDYYAHVLGYPVDEAGFARLDEAFHDVYRAGLAGCVLAGDAVAALDAWARVGGTQSLLSMFFHNELVGEVNRHGLAGRLSRVDGLRDAPGGGFKAGHLAEHLAAAGLRGDECVLVGDSVDDADAAAAVGAGCVLYAGGFTDPRRLAATGLPVAANLLDAVALAGSASGQVPV